MVSVWFKNEAALILMIEIMKVMREKMAKTKYCVNGERVTQNLAMSPRRNLWAHAVFFKGLLEARRNDKTIKTVYGSLQISSFAEVGPQGQRHLAAKYTREGEGHANEGWQIHQEVVSQVCADFNG